MKAENMTQAADAFNENVSNSMRWFQESTALIFETQSKQMKFATDMYATMLNNYFGSFDTKNLMNSTFGTQKMTEMIAINIDHIAKMAEENLKVLNDFSNQANSGSFIKESMEKLVDYYRKQGEMINNFNQTAMQAFMKETEMTNDFVKPFTDNLKTEFGLTSQLWNEGFKDMVATFSNLSNPSVETNRKFAGNFADQMQTMFRNSIGLWSEMLNNQSTNSNHATPAETITKKETVVAKSKVHAAHV